MKLAKKTQILLREFLRKSVESYLLKAIIRNSGAHLSRKGRSRHWILIADRVQIAKIIEQIELVGLLIFYRSTFKPVLNVQSN